MVTKAYVKSLPEIGSNIYTVRVPLMEDNTGNEAIFDATLCTFDSYNSLAVGDCVYVTYEDQYYNDAIILGKLYTEVPTESSSYNLVNELKVTDNAILPANTKIGNITVEDLNGMYNSVVNNETTIIEGGSQEYHTFELKKDKWIACLDSAGEGYYLYILSGVEMEGADVFPELTKLTGDENPSWDIIVDPTDTSITYKNQIKYRAWCTTLDTYSKYMTLMALDKPTDNIVLEINSGLNLGFSESK